MRAAAFWLCQSERIAQNLVLQRLLAEQPVQLAHLVLLKAGYFGDGHDLLGGPDRRQCALGAR